MPDTYGVQKNASEEVDHRLIPIHLASLQVDTVMDFDIFMRPKNAASAVLYREKNLPFTEAVCNRLRNRDVEGLYVDSSEEYKFRRYVETNIGRILADDSITLEKRSELAYTSAQGLVEDLLADPRSGDLHERSGNLVMGIMKFMLDEKSALHNLMQVMSFDYYTYTHSVNVFVFSTALAQRCGYNDEIFLSDFGKGALLHDIGKSFLPPELVNFPGKFTKQQFEQMKLHPVYGYDLLKEEGALGTVGLDVVRNHHEKLRGGGYPDNLKGDEIPPYVRMCTIADIFDAVTTERSYQGALHSFPALQLMKDEILPDLDPVFFREFVEMLGATND